MEEKVQKPLPIGVENFEEIIKKDYYYVDKTLFIKELLDKKGKVNVFTRPRRFGKSLNISMLQYYFENLKEGQSHIFNGLSIMEAGDRYYIEQNQFPVIKLSLKDAEGSTFGLAYRRFKLEIGSEFRRHRYLLNSDKLDDEEKQTYQYIIEKSLPLPPKKNDGKQGESIEEAKERELTSFSNSLKFLSECLERHYNQKVIILIDEYDVPLEKSYFGGYYEEMIEFVRSLFSSTLKTNEALEFAVITGCLRVSKETIFTGINNLQMVSIASHEYGEYFGFTEQEMKAALTYYQLEAKEAEAQSWYNGYLFGDATVYNPWSAIKYLRDLLSGEPFPKPHWANTSSNAIIRELIELADDVTKKEIEYLIAGGTITKPIKEDIVYAEMTASMDNLWNFLFFTGYLKKGAKEQRVETIYFKLKIPNREVRYIYNRHISEWFEQKAKTFDLTTLFTAVVTGDSETFSEEITLLLAKTISYMDSAENFYHGFLVGVLGQMENYVVKSNRETGRGRSDIYIKPLSVRKQAMIIEIKVADDITKLEEACHEAMAQIDEKRYVDELRTEGYRDFIKYGVGFYRKECEVITGTERVE